MAGPRTEEVMGRLGRREPASEWNIPERTQSNQCSAQTIHNDATTKRHERVGSVDVEHMAGDGGSAVNVCCVHGGDF